jgi:hypothetical protein
MRLASTANALFNPRQNRKSRDGKTMNKVKKVKSKPVRR